MAICPVCKAVIDDDSCYCDQCGNELYACPDCRKIGKGEGKRCGGCGKPLVKAAVVFGAAAVSHRPAATGETSGEAAWLVCAEQHLRLPLKDNAVIGRTCGDYLPQLSTMIYISGTHARLNKAGGQWSITDLGSRNGTKVNGMPCNPTLPFRKGDVVRIANFYNFKVE